MRKENKQINILYLHNISQISGGEQSLLSLWQNLDRQRFTPYLILPEGGPLAVRARQLNIEVSFLKIPQLSPINILNIVNVCWRLLKYLKEKNIRIIHSYTPRNNIVSSLVGRIFGIPVIWHERNLIFGDEKDISRQFLFLPDVIICNSQAVARRFPGDKKVRVVLNGVDLDHFQVVENTRSFKEKLGLKNQKVVGFVSNLNSRKRVEFFLEIASEVYKQHSNVMFVVIGGEFPDEGGRRLAELKNLAKKLRIEERIIFTGFQNDVRDFLYAFDVFVHVTIKEACSRAIIEAMAAGKPVVAVNDGGNPELILNNVAGFLFDSMNLKGFVEAILELLNNEKKCLELAFIARNRMEKLFDVKRNTKETEEIYTEIVR